MSAAGNEVAVGAMAVAAETAMLQGCNGYSRRGGSSRLGLCQKYRCTVLPAASGSYQRQLTQDIIDQAIAQLEA